MALKKKAVEAPYQATITIEQWANLYESFNAKIKALEKEMKPAKEALLNYAKEHREKFEDNKLRFPNGVYIECRNRMVDSYDKDAMSMKWLNRFIENGGEELVDVKFNTKAISENKKDAVAYLLQKIDYTIEVKESMAVCTEK